MTPFFFFFKCRDLWKVHHPDQWFLNLSMQQNYLEGLLKHRLLGCTPRILTSYSWVWVWESAFLTSFQVTLMLLAQGPHLWTANLESQNLIGLLCVKSNGDIGKEIKKVDRSKQGTRGKITYLLLSGWGPRFWITFHLHFLLYSSATDLSITSWKK